MSESYLLLKQIQDYGIEFLFPENINIGIIHDDSENYDHRYDPTEDEYYQGYIYHDVELDNMDDNDEEVYHNTENISIVKNIDELMQLFNYDYMEPNEFLSMNIWDLFGISKNQFKMINWEQIASIDFNKFYDAFMDNSRNLPIEKRIRYAIAEVETKYREIRYYTDETHSSEQMLQYAEHIIDTHSINESQHLISLLLDYLKFYPDAITMNNRRRENRQDVFDYSFTPKPTHLQDLHDKAFRDYEAMETERACESREVLNEKIKATSMTPDYMQYLYKDNDYAVISVTCQEDLEKEGQYLNHCVASYGNKMAEQDSYIYLIRKTNEIDTPFYTAEIKPAKTIKAKAELTQLYTFNDTIDKTDDFKQFIYSWINKIKISVKCKI